MKIGLAVGFFDFRNDVRRLIDALRQQHEVVLFCLPRDEKTVRAKIAKDQELRLIHEGRSSWLQDKLFQVGRRLPRSRENFYLMEQFKLSLNKSASKRLYARAMLELCYRTPAFYDYDAFLDRQQYSGETQIDDIDSMLFFTEIIDDGFFARAIRERRNPLVYVYSWDHPCKQYRFSCRANYLVWSEGIKDDLQALQGIAPEQITILGASQFAYVLEYRRLEQKPLRRFNFPYIYFGCAIGIPELVGDEIRRILSVADKLDELDSPLKLVVRPYPVLNDWGYYGALEAHSRIVVDDGYRTADLSVAEDMLMDKFATVEYANAFLHLGTTLGYEACFLPTPSFILDYGYPRQTKPLSLKSFARQYQNVKYLMPKGFPNVISSEAELAQTLSVLAEPNENLLDYNRHVTRDVELKSFSNLAEDLVAAARGGMETH